MNPQLKSKTNWAGMVVAMLGFIETNAPMLRDMLGEWYGTTYIVIGVVMIGLRQVTTKPVAAK